MRRLLCRHTRTCPYECRPDTSSLEYLCITIQGKWHSARMPLPGAQLFIGFGMRSHDLSVDTPEDRNSRHIRHSRGQTMHVGHGVSCRGPVAMRDTVGTDVREPRSRVGPENGQARERTALSRAHGADRHAGMNESPVEGGRTEARKAQRMAPTRSPYGALQR